MKVKKEKLKAAKRPDQPHTSSVPTPTAHNKASLPAGWKWVKLGEYVNSIKGKKPKRVSPVKTKECTTPYINIWRAFEQLEKVNGQPKNELMALVSLIRNISGIERGEEVRESYLRSQQRAVPPD